MQTVSFYRIVLIITLISCTTASLLARGATEQQAVLNIYSTRNYASDRMIIENFETEHRIRVNLITGKARELITRLIVEQDSTPADLLITTDAGSLAQAHRKALLQPIDSAIGSLVPTYMKGSDNSWIAITKRARVFIYDPKRNDPADFPSYESLADPASSITVAVRSSSNAYNVSLIASRITLIGKEPTAVWIRGLKDSFARDPQGNDRDQMKLAAAGGADIAISNSYYLGLLVHSEDPAEQKVGNSLQIFFPNQDSTGTHINISGVGLSRYASNKALAEKFVAFLLSEDAQNTYAQYNYEYPVNPIVDPHPTVAAWGDFVESDLDLSQLGVYAEDALALSEQNGWK